MHRNLALKATLQALQNQNIAQTKTIIECETELQQNKTKLLQLSADVTLVDSERKALKETVNELNIEIARLEGNITYLEEEREKSEHDLKTFIEKLEIKAQSWKNMLDAKEKEVKKLRTHLEKVGETASLSENATRSGKEDLGKNAINSDTDKETTRLLHVTRITLLCIISCFNAIGEGKTVQNAILSNEKASIAISA